MFRGFFGGQNSITRASLANDSFACDFNQKSRHVSPNGLHCDQILELAVNKVVYIGIVAAGYGKNKTL